MLNQNLVSAVFDSQSEAERAFSELRSAGVPDSALSLIAKHDGKTSTTTGEGHTEEHGGSILRGIIGGGALGAGLGVAALAIPGVGPLAAAGAIAASAVPEAMGIGALIGAAAGSVNEVLEKHGVGPEDVTYYNGQMETGGVFVSADTSAAGVDATRVREILMQCGGHNASSPRVMTSI